MFWDLVRLILEVWRKPWTSLASILVLKGRAHQPPISNPVGSIQQNNQVWLPPVKSNHCSTSLRDTSAGANTIRRDADQEEWLVILGAGILTCRFHCCILPQPVNWVKEHVHWSVIDYYSTAFSIQRPTLKASDWNTYSTQYWPQQGNHNIISHKHRLLSLLSLLYTVAR